MVRNLQSINLSQAPYKSFIKYIALGESAVDCKRLRINKMLSSTLTIV
jgi:hypothetical protein